MTSKLLAGGAAALALSINAGGALAQPAVVEIKGPPPPNAVIEVPTSAPADASADSRAAATAPAPAPPSRRGRETRRADAARRDPVTSTLAGVPGLVGRTVGGGLAKAGSVIGGSLGLGH